MKNDETSIMAIEIYEETRNPIFGLCWEDYRSLFKLYTDIPQVRLAYYLYSLGYRKLDKYTSKSIMEGRLICEKHNVTIIPNKLCGYCQLESSQCQVKNNINTNAR